MLKKIKLEPDHYDNRYCVVCNSELEQRPYRKTRLCKKCYRQYRILYVRAVASELYHVRKQMRWNMQERD